jgi:hypothetical protein
LAVTIIKPLRKRIIETILRKSKEDQRAKTISSMDKKIDQLLVENKKLDTRLTRVEANVLKNEADRLRAELFDCGNRCRRKIRLHPEEMDHIIEVYNKYSIDLGQNGPGKKEYEYISDYYNNQSFPPYHTQQND